MQIGKSAIVQTQNSKEEMQKMMIVAIQKTQLGNYKAISTENSRLKSVRLVRNLSQLPANIFQEASFEQEKLYMTTGQELETFTGLETSESTDRKSVV